MQQTLSIFLGKEIKENSMVVDPENRSDVEIKYEEYIDKYPNDAYLGPLNAEEIKRYGPLQLFEFAYPIV